MPISFAQPVEDSRGYIFLYLVALIVSVSLIYGLYEWVKRLLQEQRDKERRAALWEKFRQNVILLAKERDIVCELCLKDWKEEKGYANLRWRLGHYARRNPDKVQFGGGSRDQLKEHLSRYHPLERVSTDITRLAHVIRRPTLFERTYKRLLE
jgi:hypothetical protein